METTYIHPDKVVEVFKTNVDKEWQARRVILTIKEMLPEARVNFDLEDCDRILRIEMQGTEIDRQIIVKVVNAAGCFAEVLG